VVFLILALFPWWNYGDSFFGISYSLSGFSSGLVSSAFVLFLLATVWTALPAFYDLALSFPRSWITVGLAGLGLLLTLFAWIDTFSAGFSIWALLGFATAVAIALFAVFTLLPELHNRPAMPGNLANAAQWANQPAPGAGQQGPGQPPGQSTYGHATPPRPAPGTPMPPPPAAGGSTGAGPGVSTDRPGGV